MDLRIRPHAVNIFPLRGILIKNSSIAACLKEVQDLKWKLKEIQLFAVPDTTPNSIWGCLVIFPEDMTIQKAGRNEMVQMPGTNLFIAERSILQPVLRPAEIEQMFSSAIHLFHPEIGLVALEEALDVNTLLSRPLFKICTVTRPEEGVFIPREIISFEIQASTPEETLKNLEDHVFPSKEVFREKPLNILEKIKLFFYRLLFIRNDKEGNPSVKPGKLWMSFFNLINRLTGLSNITQLADKLLKDFNKLDERNKKEVDKLIDLLKKDPENALKYAIPLDSNGSTRGDGHARLDLSKRWMSFSLFGGNISYGSGGVDLGEHFHSLERQYHETARKLIQQKDYQKAAFIYMKLLKDYNAAAQTLEDGGYFQEAASIYLKHMDNKKKAAACYERGNMITDAIELYKELEENEKVADLYLSLNKRKEAEVYFEKVIDIYKRGAQHVKAALIYRDKLNNKQEAQAVLLDGWRNHKDAYNCLNNYLANIEDIKTLKREINIIYQTEVSKTQSLAFLQVIHHESIRHKALFEPMKELAYEIVAANISNNPAIVSELKNFNQGDRELVKDTIRFKLNRNKG